MHRLMHDLLVSIRELSSRSSHVGVECPQLSGGLLVPAVENAVKARGELQEPIDLAVKLGAGDVHA